MPVIKGTSGILLLTDDEVQDITTFNCIRCGRCLDACPLFLNPARMGALAKKGLWEEMEAYNVLDCFECGSCSFVCPIGYR
ncbi:MAG: 4Fe-4S dicluster domain-containing protein [Saprospiraceae bacterium]